MRDGRVLAVEAAEGTDRMLTRLAEAGDRRAAGRYLVKGPKPGQELRIDMPVIGPRTVELAAEAGLAGIAVEAGRVLAAERAELVDCRRCRRPVRRGCRATHVRTGFARGAVAVAAQSSPAGQSVCGAI